MNAGRELDALIAEKVLGLVARYIETDEEERRWNGDDWFMGSADLIEEIGQYRGIGGYGEYNIPPYSTDISAAWLVVQNLRERGWFFDIGDKPSDENDMMSPRVWNAFVDRIIFGPNADTPMLAICLAALKAIEEHQS